jgi:N-methylhydantoinase A/oxoprolinase/acetone carboxylase beta subunit
VFCALGAVASDIALTVEIAVPMRMSREAPAADVDMEEVERSFAELERRAHAALAAQGVAPGQRSLQRFIEVRFKRQSKALSIAYRDSVDAVVREFLDAYTRRFGAASVPRSAGFEFVNFLIEASGSLRRPTLARYPFADESATAARRTSRRAYDAGSRGFVETAVYDGPSLRPGNRLTGPAIVEYDDTTLVLITGQIAAVNEYLGVSVRRAA